MRATNMCGMAKEQAADPTRWWTYIQGVLDSRGWSGADFQRATGVDRSRLNAWRSGELPKAPMARRVAASLEEPVLTVFVAAGILEPGDVGARPAPSPTPIDVRDVPSVTLVREVARRMGVQGAVTLVPPTDDEVRADPGRYSVGRLSLDETDHDRDDAVAGDPPIG